MAAKPLFRVPTLEEMEKADQQEALLSNRNLLRRDGSSKSADTATNADSPSPKSRSSKRMLSQKALLSRMPLSRRPPPSRQSKVVPAAKSPEKVQSAPVDKEVTVPTSGDPLAWRRVAHVPKDNDGSSSKGQGLPATSGAGSTSITTDIRNNWTGNTLGGDSFNAQLSQQNLLAASGAAVPQKETTGNKPPSEQTAGARVTTSEGTAEQPQDSVRADVLPTLAKLGKTNSLVVNSRQRGNPILKFVRNVPWEFGNIVPDYVMGQSNCALYLSLRYHQLHPEYIHSRLKQLGHSFDLRVLLVQVDIKDPHHLLKDLAKICILADCTLMVAFSAEEAGRYLETYKVYENKAAEAIMERTDGSFSIQLSDCLTRVKAVNKTDCSTLLATFGNLKGIMEASSEDLSLCPGFGPQKAKRLHDIFREPFLVSKKHRPDTTDTKK
ncbi:hypothetical protein ACOMHN_044315 [Nucella lapillus]